MEPPQLVTQELIDDVRNFLKKPENIGFVTGFSLTVIVGFIIFSKLYQRRKGPKAAAHDYAYGGKARKKGFMSHLIDYGLEYGFIFFLSLVKENIQKYVAKLNEDLKEHKEEITGE
ncbi:MAG: GNAT family N-acetyltransferase [Candidatus Cyclobacteriaceae bacterium M2_1C_046]